MQSTQKELQAKITELKKEAENYNNENNILKMQIQQKEQQIKDFRESTQKQFDELLDLQEKTQNLQDQLDESKKDKKTLESQIAQLKEENQAATSTKSSNGGNSPEQYLEQLSEEKDLNQLQQFAQLGNAKYM